MQDEFSRTELLLGRDNMVRLKNARVAVFGVGGVGSYVVEALARSGVGSLDLIDDDRVCVTNLNRQLIALHSCLGQYKADVAMARVLEINPKARVNVHKVFYLPETAGQFDFTAYDYVADAIDTVAGKLALVEQAKSAGIPIISSMGTGNKLDPTAFRVADIYETKGCPLARVMRRECRKRGIDSLKVVYSTEPALNVSAEEADEGRSRDDVSDIAGERKEKRRIPGSVAFVPSVAGLIIAGEIIKDLTVRREEGRGQGK